MQETLSFGGRPAAGFSLGSPNNVGVGDSKPVEVVKVTPALATVSVGVTAGLFAAVLHAPLWGSILAGAGAALVTKVGIDKAAEQTA